MTTIGTHNGTFHCDEALACYMLRKTQQFANAAIVRSRDRTVLDKQTIVVDVGDVYDPLTLRFDHHQKGFFQTFSENHQTKLSSAGLIYKHFGKEIITNMSKTVLDEHNLQLIYVKVYESIIEGIDGIDNGITPYKCLDDNCTAGVRRMFNMDTDLSARVGRLLPLWNEPYTDDVLDKLFLKAMDLAGGEFADRVKYFTSSWLPGRQIVLEAVESRIQYEPEGRIMVMDQFCPWKDHLFRLEDELRLPNPILYVVYADSNGTWRVQAVPIHSGSFASRKALPSSWQGLRDQALSEVTGIAGSTFVHNTGFIGGNATRDGAIQMALAAISLP